MRRSRWWPPLLLLAVIPLMVGMSVANAAELMPTAQGPKASAVQYVPRDVPVGVIVAPTLSAEPDPSTYIQQIEVILPPPPPPPPATGNRRRGGSGIDASAAAASGLTYSAWCEAGGGSSIGASSLSGLLEAANTERARWGFAPLAWSGSLASAAQGWSDSMASSYDPGDPGAAMQHNPGRPPGGENVAASWTNNPAGMGVSSAMDSAHRRWMTSSGHCKNILRPGWTVMGAGTAQSSDGRAWYTTVNFQ